MKINKNVAVAVVACTMAFSPMMANAEPNAKAQQLMALAQKADTNALLELATMYQNGSNGLVKDAKKAYDLIAEHVDQSPKLMTRLAQYLEQGIGCSPNMKLAMEYLDRACEGSDQSACKQMNKFGEMAVGVADKVAPLLGQAKALKALASTKAEQGENAAQNGMKAAQSKAQEVRRAADDQARVVKAKADEAARSFEKTAARVKAESEKVREDAQKDKDGIMNSLLSFFK